MAVACGEVGLSGGAPSDYRSSGRTRRRFSIKDVGFFEGPEKLLEVWFNLCPKGEKGVLEEEEQLSNEVKCDERILTKEQNDNHLKGLRIIPRCKWEEILSLVHCEILSECSNHCMDAYLLSESSMLVTENRFILKTCGTTTLLHAIEPILSLVESFYPGSAVVDIFYSHRNFQKPHLQPHPHHSFEEEVRYLDNIFEGGAAYALGRLNGDTWYLYTMEKGSHPSQVSDQTLEILMTDLDPEFLSIFSTEYSTSEQLTRDVGLADLVPDAIIDSKIFEPCGYSLNAIVTDDTYFTVHVTPQVECSWVSFETNLEQESYNTLISKVLAIFKPTKCTISLFASKNALCGNSFTAFQDRVVDGYDCKDRQFCSFRMYNLTFAHYTRTTVNIWEACGSTTASSSGGSSDEEC